MNLHIKKLNLFSNIFKYEYKYNMVNKDDLLNNKYLTN